MLKPNQLIKLALSPPELLFLMLKINCRINKLNNISDVFLLSAEDIIRGIVLVFTPFKTYLEITTMPKAYRYFYMKEHLIWYIITIYVFDINHDK